MLLTDQTLRTIAIERATSTGGASDMALVGGMPATFEPVRLDSGTIDRPLAVDPPDAGAAAPAPAGSSPATFPTFDMPSPLASSGFSSFGGAGSTPIANTGPVQLGTTTVGSGSVTPALAGAADTIGISAAALASAIGNLTDLLRKETPAATPHLDQLQSQLQSLGLQAQQLAGGPAAIPVDVATGIVAGTVLTAEAIAADAASVVTGTVDIVIDAVAALPAVTEMVAAPVGAIVDTATDVVTEAAQTAAPVVEAVTDLTVETVAGVTDAVGEVVDVTGAIVAPIVQTVAGTVADATGDAVDLVGDTVAGALAAAPPVVDAVATTVGHVAAAVPATAAPLVSSVTDIAESTVTQTIVAAAPATTAVAQGVVEATDTGATGAVDTVASVVDAITDADAPFGGSDPLGGMATLHDLLAGENGFELVDTVADTVVFASAGTSEPEHDAIAPLETLVTTPVETLLGATDDDDHHGLLGGLGLGFEHG